MSDYPSYGGRPSQYSSLPTEPQYYQPQVESFEQQEQQQSQQQQEQQEQQQSQELTQQIELQQHEEEAQRLSLYTQQQLQQSQIDSPQTPSNAYQFTRDCTWNDLFNLHWTQALPALVVTGVIIGTTVPPLMRAIYNYCHGSSSTSTSSSTPSSSTDNDTKSTPTVTPTTTTIQTSPSSPKSTASTTIIDIEDLATKPTTCNIDSTCSCECPFPLQKHNCTIGEDGTMKYLPIPVDVPTDGSSLWLCTCGLSKSFPHCDGSHRNYNKEHGTNVGPYEVNQENADGKAKVWVCGCGHSQSRKGGKPFCDGSHKKVQPLDEPNGPKVYDDCQ